MDKVAIIGVSLFALIGIGASTGSYFAYQSWVEVGTWPQAEATVINNGYGRENEPWYMVEWTGADGEARTFTAYGSSPSRGTTYTVYIDPEDPDNADFREMVPMGALIFFGLGAGFLFITGKVLWGSILAWRKEPDVSAD